jgi:hypothetical protein
MMKGQFNTFDQHFFEDVYAFQSINVMLFIQAAHSFVLLTYFFLICPDNLFILSLFITFSNQRPSPGLGDKKEEKSVPLVLLELFLWKDNHIHTYY